MQASTGTPTQSSMLSTKEVTSTVTTIKEHFEPVTCPPEDFDHYYEVPQADGSIKLVPHRNHFPRTKANSIAVPRDLCLSNSNQSLMRLCEPGRGDLDSPKWRELGPVTCRHPARSQPEIKLETSTSSTCEAEDFQHRYQFQLRDGRIVTLQHLNRFGRTKAGKVGTMRDLCLKSNGLPVTRRCLAQQAGAVWESLEDVMCHQGSQYEVSQQLNTLHHKLGEPNPLNSYAVAKEVRHLLAQSEEQKKLLPADVVTTEAIFRTLAEVEKNAELGTDLLGICSDLMATNTDLLRLSAELNATNGLLHSFESYIDALPQQLVPRESCHQPVAKQMVNSSAEEGGVKIINYAHIGVQAMMSQNLSVFFVNPSCHNITGIAIYGQEAPQLLPSYSGFWFRFLYANESVYTLKTEALLEVATFLTEELWHAVHSRGANYLIFKVYAYDTLFVETTVERMRRPRSKVLSISIPDYKDKLPFPLPFLLRNENQKNPDSRAIQMGSGCGYWNYETWLSDGIETTGNNLIEDPIIVCYAYHLTQFSFLLGGSYAQQRITDIVLIEVASWHERVLDRISIVGCCLSLFGLLGIWVTAILFKNWRSQASTMVLLHLCLALTLQMILLIFLNTQDVAEQLALERDARCIALGALLHYSVLVVFSWMLIIAFMQFQRFVTVIGFRRPQHYIAIAALVAWTLPLLPTLLLVALDPQSYVPSQDQEDTHTAVCYPSGYGLTYGVVLPIALVTAANALMVFCIMHSVFKVQTKKRQLIFQQLRLCVLLFFLLGLTWIFGLCSYMRFGIAFSYLFCVTASLQGFVIFVYFVVVNRSTRNSWRALLNGSSFKGGQQSSEGASRTLSRSTTQSDKTTVASV
ncbi:adhesion G-protein coupled receptor G7-like [Scaptodrosophila lebanonensis]|uniref:Adhesion G-protein coupled receptor G7-like n=1 Tax=Drosophila lebanonensis TaxID=7225 RepID=A0A6J2SZQ9_DROLE|nr:adhesion G-protein coupled receptor G7-like [Scaptodrosophila lebanonensis]